MTTAYQIDRFNFEIKYERLADNNIAVSLLMIII